MSSVRRSRRTARWPYGSGARTSYDATCRGFAVRRCLGLRPHGDVQIVAFSLQATREPCWSLPSCPEVFGINEGTTPPLCRTAAGHVLLRRYPVYPPIFTTELRPALIAHRIAGA